MLTSIFEKNFGRASLVRPDDTWYLLFILVLGVAISIFLEHKYNWASRISGAIIALIIALILSNLAIIPIHSPLYDDVIWRYAVPLGIPLLLLECNIKRVWKETGKILLIFLIGSFGTALGTLVAYYLVGNYIPEVAGVSAMMTGTYIGGSVNLAALASQFKVSGQTIGAATVADNLLMAIYFFVLIMFAGMKFFRKHFNHPHINTMELGKDSSGEKGAGIYWTRKDMSLRDIAINVALSVTIVFFSNIMSACISSFIPKTSLILTMLNTFFSSQYVWIASISMMIASIAEEKLAGINGAQEIGTYFIYMFLFVIGVPASIIEIITNTPALLVFAAIIVASNMVFCFVGGKLLNIDLEDCILASNANIGGPTTAASMAISQGWTKLVGPIMLVGTLGYVLGTYAGVIIGSILGG